MKLTLLGCGTSTGVPVITCRCKVCRSRNPRNQRLRASAWLQIRGKSILIDTSTDLRAQALRHRIPRVDAVLYTHPHADHISGIDELRAYNFAQKGSIPVYGNAWTALELRQKFEYIFNPSPVEGGGIPLLELREFQANGTLLDVAGVEVLPIALAHGSRECIAYRFGDAAYVTDVSRIPAPSLEKLRGLKLLVLDCLRIVPHNTHFNLEQALATIAELKPRKTVLTHMGHEIEYATWSKKLPRGVLLGYDGMSLTL